MIANTIVHDVAATPDLGDGVLQEMCVRPARKGGRAKERRPTMNIRTGTGNIVPNRIAFVCARCQRSSVQYERRCEDTVLKGYYLIGHW